MKEKANNQVLFEQVRAIGGEARAKARAMAGREDQALGAARARARGVFERGRRAVTTNDARSKDGMMRMTTRSTRRASS